MNLRLLTLLILTCAFQSYAQHQVVAENLNGPFSIDTDYLGNHWITEIGSGNTDGGVTVVQPDGKKIPVITGLPSYLNPDNQEVTGAWHSLRLPKKQIAVVIGEGNTKDFGRIAIFDLSKFVLGTSRPLTLNNAIQIIDVSTYVLGLEGVGASNPYSVARDWNGNWYVTDAGANNVIKISKDGKKHSVFADLKAFANPLPFGPPVVDQVPTKIISRGHNSFFLAQLTGFPFAEGAAKIYSINEKGEVFDYAKGLTTLIDIALDKKTGDLYALQFANFGFQPAPGFVPNTSKVSKISHKDQSIETIAEGFGPATGFSRNSHGEIFITEPFSNRLLEVYHPHSHPSLRAKETTLISAAYPQKNPNRETLQVYPNPTVDEVSIEWSTTLMPSSGATIQLVDLSGKVLLRQTINEPGLTQTVRLNSVKSGMYLLQLNHALGQETKKIVVKK